MILSKLSVHPLRGPTVLRFQRVALVQQSSQLATQARPPILVRRNVPFSQKNVINYFSKRNFKSPPNSFQNHKEKFGARASEVLVLTAANSVFFYLLIDVQYIWANLMPKSITDTVENAWEASMSFLRKVYRVKTADSLAKDGSFLNGDESTESAEQQNAAGQSGVVEQSVLSNVLYYFNVKRDQESKTGGFRDKKIIEYENRIRLYSNPEKIFRYFASIKIVYSNGDSEIYMTPDDFLRALTPGVKQPDGLGLDQYKKIDLSKEKNDFKYELKPDSIFYKLSKFGLINFSDFLFLLTVISVSKRHFEIAFRFFDDNGDGDLEYDEFEKVQNAILSQTSIGQKMGKSVHYKGVSSAVSRYFFGEDLKRRLTIDNFLDFQKSLQSELLNLEFERKHPDENGRISEVDFAELLVAYAILSEKKRRRMIKRVMKKFGDKDTVGINLQEYQSFFRFLQNINDVDIALTVYNIAGASIDQATLKHVAQTVAHVELSDHLVEVVFTLFDDNEDGQLSNKEFISVMKERLRRGLAKPKDTGFFKIMYTIWKSLTTLDF